MNQNYNENGNSLYEMDMDCIKEQETAIFSENNTLIEGMGFDGNCDNRERRRKERREERREENCRERSNDSDRDCRERNNRCRNLNDFDIFLLILLLILFC